VDRALSLTDEQPCAHRADKVRMPDKKSAALQSIVGTDPELQAVLARTALVAPTVTPVLVTGESGTGKELLARALHDLGPNPGGPFVAVNCGALPRELAESELFGHERGAFTGAAARRKGWFEEASGGTLVLDEIGELPLELQPKLLRVLESGRIRRVGGAGETSVPVRVVAMTLRNLKGEAQRGMFRTDLYYRLAGFELALPPLRRRRADIPLLVQHFLRELEPELGAREIDPAALEALEAAEWPGNIRELRNVIRKAAILTGSRIDAAALELPPPPLFRIAESPPNLRLSDVDPIAAIAAPPAVATAGGDSLRLSGRTFEEIEREVFSWALRRNAGSRRRAAKALSVARSTFCDKVKKYDLGKN
jgi:two-component system nitrogen regulation response regulator GlnG